MFLLLWNYLCIDDQTPCLVFILYKLIQHLLKTTIKRKINIWHIAYTKSYTVLIQKVRCSLTLKVAISWNSSQSTKPWIIDKVASNDRFLSLDELTVLSSLWRKCTIWNTTIMIVYLKTSKCGNTYKQRDLESLVEIWIHAYCLYSISKLLLTNDKDC